MVKRSYMKTATILFYVSPSIETRIKSVNTIDLEGGKEQAQNVPNLDINYCDEDGKEGHADGDEMDGEEEEEESEEVESSSGEESSSKVIVPPCRRLPHRNSKDKTSKDSSGSSSESLDYSSSSSSSDSSDSS